MNDEQQQFLICLYCQYVVTSHVDFKSWCRHPNHQLPVTGKTLPRNPVVGQYYWCPLGAWRVWWWAGAFAGWRPRVWSRTEIAGCMSREWAPRYADTPPAPPEGTDDD